MAGYSGTPLARKLGIKAGHRVVLVAAPAGFERNLEGLPDGVSFARQARGIADIILLFALRATDLAARFSALARYLDPAGGLWVAWPKKASGRATDLTEGVVRDIGLSTGLVDNKVCAVDEVWSGLRFVVRLADRPPRTPAKRSSR
ncbi:MAG TPA: hypothetical protein VNO33_19455 [Kofleriaceae bacterium]|nr:hypothetical protein [Kofleriaceae bacterium]